MRDRDRKTRQAEKQRETERETERERDRERERERDRWVRDRGGGEGGWTDLAGIKARGLTPMRLSADTWTDF